MEEELINALTNLNTKEEVVNNELNEPKKRNRKPKISVLKCHMCDFTTTKKSDLERHLLSKVPCNVENNVKFIVLDIKNNIDSLISKATIEAKSRKNTTHNKKLLRKLNILLRYDEEEPIYSEEEIINMIVKIEEYISSIDKQV